MLIKWLLLLLLLLLLNKTFFSVIDCLADPISEMSWATSIEQVLVAIKFREERICHVQASEMLASRKFYINILYFLMIHWLCSLLFIPISTLLQFPARSHCRSEYFSLVILSSPWPLVRLLIYVPDASVEIASSYLNIHFSPRIIIAAHVVLSLSGNRSLLRLLAFFKAKFRWLAT